MAENLKTLKSQENNNKKATHTKHPQKQPFLDTAILQRPMKMKCENVEEQRRVKES